MSQKKKKTRENVEVVSSSADHSPAMVMTLRPREDEEEEVIDLSSDKEEEHPVISGILQTHIQPKLTTKTSQNWLNETMGGLNVLSKVIKKGKVGRISQSPSPKKNLSGEDDPLKLSPSDLRHAINRQKQLDQQRKLAKNEQKARKKAKKAFEKETKRRAKASNNRIERAELALNAPVAALHPTALHTSTPTRVTADQLRDGLRSVVQEGSSFYNFNGQPGLSPGCWPDTLSWPQTKKAYRRNYNKAANLYPEVATEMYDPSAFPDKNEPEISDSEVVEPEVAGPEVDEPVADEQSEGGVEGEDGDDVVIPSLEELLANPIPSTSKGSGFQMKKKPFVKTPFPICKMGSLLTYGRKLFNQGADIDELIEQTINELASRRAAKELLELEELENEIGARRISGAEKIIASQIANLIDRLKYLNGRRNRLLETLGAQQSRLDEFVNYGADKSQKCQPTGKMPDPTEFWKSIHGLEQEAEVEESRCSSDFSNEGKCSPDKCKCTDKKCEENSE